MILTPLLVTLSLALPALAQTTTGCDPTKKTCDPDLGFTQSNYEVDFTKGADNNTWNLAQGTTINYSSSGAEFTIAKQGQAPTMSTKWYFFFGRVEIHMKAATGIGIVSSLVLMSDDKDEIDWEYLGGSTNRLESDYFGKGNSTQGGRAAIHKVSDGQTAMHNYTIDWTKEALTWYIDGKNVHRVTFSEALGGKNYPQTPVQLKLGAWAGGDPGNAQGTINWAGGKTDYTKGPFTMTVQSVKLFNANPAARYRYKDQSGTFQSIQLVDGRNGSSNENGTGTGSGSGSGSTSLGGSFNRTITRATRTATGTITGTTTSTIFSTTTSTSFSIISTTVSGSNGNAIVTATETAVSTFTSTLSTLSTFGATVAAQSENNQGGQGGRGQGFRHRNGTTASNSSHNDTRTGNFIDVSSNRNSSSFNPESSPGYYGNGSSVVISSGTALSPLSTMFLSLTTALVAALLYI